MNLMKKIYFIVLTLIFSLLFAFSSCAKRGTIIGVVFIGGEIISCLLMSLIFINSLKTIFISFPVKLVL